MNQLEIIQKVKDFYKEKNLDPTHSLTGYEVCARLVLFTEWLQEQNKPDINDEETWEDIFNAQPK